MNNDELTVKAEAEDEKFRVIVKKLTRVILLLILVILLIIGGAVYYFVKEYGKEKNVLSTINETEQCPADSDFYKLMVYIDTDADEETEQAAYNQILTLPNVASATFISKEQAFEEFKESLGDEADVLDGLDGEKFLRSSVEITLKDTRKEGETITELEKIPGVAKVDSMQAIREFFNLE